MRAFMRLVAENPEEDIMGGLTALFAQKAAGKDIGTDLDGAWIWVRGKRRAGRKP